MIADIMFIVGTVLGTLAVALVLVVVWDWIDPVDPPEQPARAPWGEWRQSTATGFFNTMHGRRGMPKTDHIEGTWPARKCELCAAIGAKKERIS